MNAVKSQVRRLSSLLQDRSRADVETHQEDGEWAPGGRYKALERLTLHAELGSKSPAMGTLRAKEDALLLGLWRGGYAAHPDTSAEEGSLYAYVASTRTPEWRAGWIELLGPPSSGSKAKLGTKLQRGSWEVGGRYSVVGSPLLRADKDLDSQQLSEVNKDEEVLIMELQIVMHRGEPRLRGRVRTDSGQLGWITVELPWAGPLLRPLNLYSDEAVTIGPPVLRTLTNANSKRSTRMTTTGALESSDQAWEVGGKYRLLKKAPIYAGSEFTASSQKIGSLQKGVLVEVLEKKQVDLSILHLKVVAECNNRNSRASNRNSRAPQKLSAGWIAATGRNDQRLIDIRDHLEYEKVMRLIASEAPKPHASEVMQITITSPSGTSKVPRLELERLMPDPNRAPVNAEEYVEVGPYSDSESSESIPEQGRSLPPLPTPAVDDASSPSGITKKSDRETNAFLKSDSLDDQQVRETQVDSMTVSPACWLSCGTCFTGSGKDIAMKVKTSGAAPAPRSVQAIAGSRNRDLTGAYLAAQSTNRDDAAQM